MSSVIGALLLLLPVLALGAFSMLVYDVSVLIASIVVLEAIALLALAFGLAQMRSR